MKVLIVGLGSIAAKHIAALKHLHPDADIYALRSAEGKTEAGLTNIYNLSELTIKPDFVIISNPTNLHLQTILSVAPLSVPLFIEKPPLHTLADAQPVIDELDRQCITTYVACNLRFHPCVQFLKDYFSKKQPLVINEVNVYCGSYLPDWRPGKDYKAIYSANRNMGGGVHLDLFHEMDYTSWLFGFPEKAVAVHSSKSALNIDAVDYANYILSYPGFNISVILNYYRRVPKRTIEILFDTQTWVIDLIKGTVVTDNNEIIFTSPDFKMSDTYIDQLNYFIGCIKNDVKPMNAFAESLKVLKLSLQNG